MKIGTRVTHPDAGPGKTVNASVMFPGRKTQFVMVRLDNGKRRLLPVRSLTVITDTDTEK